MKLGQIANKKVISTFVCCMCFLLVLYCTLSQVNINKLNRLEASTSLAMSNAEEVIIDTNISLSKTKGLDEIKFAEVSGFGNIPLQYSGLYNVSSTPLSQSRGALYFNGHKETYYSEKVLPGASLSIPGRHVADDGTIRDGDGFICVAADPSYMSKYSILITSLGPAKVYDTGCAPGTIDIYTSW